MMHRAWVRWSSRLRHWSGAGGRRGAGAAAAAGWAATGMGMMTAAGPGFDHDQPVKPALCRGPVGSRDQEQRRPISPKRRCEAPRRAAVIGSAEEANRVHEQADQLPENVHIWP